MFRQQLRMAAVADTDFQHIFRFEGVEVDEPVEGNLLAGRVQLYRTEKTPVDLYEKFFAELLVLNAVLPVVTHRVVFPPRTIGVLPFLLLIRIRWKRGGLGESLGQLFEFLHEFRHRGALACAVAVGVFFFPITTIPCA